MTNEAVLWHHTNAKECVYVYNETVFKYTHAHPRACMQAVRDKEKENIFKEIPD